VVAGLGACAALDGWPLVDALGRPSMTSPRLRPCSVRRPRQGNDDQVVPIADSAELSIKLLMYGTLKAYPGAATLVQALNMPAAGSLGDSVS
jgi:hypothetical protein